MMCIAARLRLARPTVPGEARSLPGRWLDKFDDLRIDRKAKSREPEPSAIAQLRTRALMEADLRDIAVVSRPKARVDEISPHFLCAEVRHDDFVGGEIVRETGPITFGPDYVAHIIHLRRRRQMADRQK